LKHKTPFNIIDIPLIRTAKNSEVIIKEIPQNNILYLEIDGESIRIEKKENRTLDMKCTCKYCGIKGIANNQLCRRKLRALWFLIQKNGRVSEIEVKK